MTRDSSPLCPACCEPAAVLVDLNRLACAICGFGWRATLADVLDALGVEAWFRRRVVHLMPHELDPPAAAPPCATTAPCPTLAADRGSP
jgi:hypothetical protein